MLYKLENFYDKVYLINLKRREDRLLKTRIEFEKHNLDFSNVNVFTAYDGQNAPLKSNNKVYRAEYGGIKSHLGVIEDAIKNKYKKILVLEDDVEFCDMFYDNLNQSINMLPKDHNFVYFGGNNIGPRTKINNRVFLVTITYALQAYSMESRVFKIISDYLNLKLNEIETLDKKGIEIKPSIGVDVLYSNLHNIVGGYYSFEPKLAFQRADYSDMQQGYVNYSFLRNK